ncbi:MAG: efflux RND transporter periplasmic adaptor subunit, partial [Chloroflexi bacterium]|nr:efflux RND transporter periplasmic adaptor subunit [Chloroflexota bacterium]
MSVQTQDLEERTELTAPAGERGGVASPPREPPTTAPAPTAPETGNGVQHGPAPAAAAVAAPAPARRRGLRRVILPIVLIVVIAAAVVGFNLWRNSQMYVSTDNASISGQPVQVGSMNAGRVDVINPQVGATVHKGDVLASVAIPSQTGMSQNGTPIVGFLGASDSRVDVVAPFDGVVIATPVAVGSTVQAGQAIVTMVDPTQLWVNANVDETAFSRLAPGQSVTVPV